MNHWGYKATSKKLDGPGTLILATRGFVCRSPFTENGSAAARVREVNVGDQIHVYYVPKDDRQHMEFGQYEVVDRDHHPHPEWFGDRFEDTALFTVAMPRFVTEIDTQGAYVAHPRVGHLAGWLVRKVGKARPYNKAAFPGQSVLVQY